MTGLGNPNLGAGPACEFENMYLNASIYLLLTHGFVFIYAISCYCAEKNGSWRAITVQMKDRRGLSNDQQGSPNDGSHKFPLGNK